MFREYDPSQPISVDNPVYQIPLYNINLIPQSKRPIVELQFSASDSLKYETGDHLGVFARNDKSLVTRVAKRLHVDLDTAFRLVSTKQGVDTPINGVVTVEQALSEYYDLTGLPTPTLLKVMASYAKDESEKNRLLELSDLTKVSLHFLIIDNQSRNPMLNILKGICLTL